MNNTQLSRLRVSAQDLGISLSDQQARVLVTYLKELVRWNQKINLSGIRDLDAMLDLHGIDSLSIHYAIQGKSVLDVGSGAGLPGIPLAIISPKVKFWLLDSNNKKTRFLTHVIGLLGLANLDVVTERVESYRPDRLFDTVVCRAFASLDKILRQAGHLCAPGGRILAMKGQYPDRELDAIPVGWSVETCDNLDVPGVVGERHLIVMKRVSDS